MGDVNFKPLFEYLDEQFKDVRNDISEVRQDVRQVQTSVDGLAKMTKDDNQEITVINNRLDKLESKVA